MKKIQLIILENNQELKNIVSEHNENNLLGSVAAYFAQEKESKTLEQLYLYGEEKGYYKNNNVVLCADGLINKKESYSNNILNEFNELIKNKYDIFLIFTNKEMKEGYSDNQINDSLTF